MRDAQTIRATQLAMHYSKLRMQRSNANAGWLIERARDAIARGDKAYYYYSATYRKEMVRGTWDDKSGAYYIGDWPDGWRVLGRVDNIEVESYGGRSIIDHRGWYTDSDQSDTIAGYVLQIPSRHGRAQFVPAMKQTDCDGVTLYPRHRCDELADAIRAADRYAEQAAEEERDYQEGYQKAREALEASQDAAEALKDAKALVVDMRTFKAVAADVGGACERLRERGKAELLQLRARARRARRESAELRSQWGSHQGFVNGLADGI